MCNQKGIKKWASNSSLILQGLALPKIRKKKYGHRQLSLCLFICIDYNKRIATKQPEYFVLVQIERSQSLYSKDQSRMVHRVSCQSDQLVHQVVSGTTVKKIIFPKNVLLLHAHLFLGISKKFGLSRSRIFPEDISRKFSVRCRRLQHSLFKLWITWRASETIIFYGSELADSSVWEET